MDTHDQMFGKYNPQRDSWNRALKKERIREYDAAIARVDEAIGSLARALETLQIDRNTLIIITADHGEEMCEHSLCFNHGGFLWDPLIRVPLIIVWKGRLPGNKKISSQVRHIDIAPTICDITGTRIPCFFEGKSLLPVIRGRVVPPRAAFSEHQERKGDIRGGKLIFSRFSLRSPPWKLIYTINPREQSYQLFNVEKDPGESNDLAETDETQCLAQKEKLKAWMNRPRPAITPATATIGDKDREKLKSLGYLQ